MADLKVLIVGCGVAGPALAIWLARVGADVTVVDRAPDLRATGQQIDVRGPAVPLMDKMGIRDEVLAVVTKEPGMQLVDARGKTMAFFPADPASSTKQGYSSEYEIMRGDLVRVLCDATKGQKGVRYLFDTSIESFTQDDVEDPHGKVHVCFADGRREDYDLVVGADGSKSKVRRLMLGPAAPDAVVPQNVHFAFFSIPPRPGDSDRWTICLRPERVALMSRRDRPDVFRAYLLIGGEQPTLDAAYKSSDRTQLRKAWAELFRGRGWEADRFVHELVHSREAGDLYAGPVEFVKLPEGGWSQGRVTLLGDAACAATLNGRGTTVALVAAYVLAGEIATLLAKGETTGRAVQQGAVNYERTMRPLAKIGQHTPTKHFGDLIPRTEWQIRFLHFVAWLVAFFRLDKLGLLAADTLDQWALPEYPSLEVGSKKER